ncbi:MAG: aspartate kinase [Planctomycetota bacterium]|jgi:aspartate kinase
MIVMKFGGTSLGDPGRVDVAARLVKKNLKRDPAVVVSAFSGITDLLIKKANDALTGRIQINDLYRRHREYTNAFGLSEDLVAADLFRLEELLRGVSLVRELTPRTLDLVVSFGEMMSHKIIAARFRDLGIPAVPAASPELGFLTDSTFGGAQLRKESYRRIRRNLQRIDGVPVVTGFIARDEEGNITTLGRSGSDYTATILGAAARAEEIQIWTDVDGVMTADPTVVLDALSIPHLSFEEASELAYYGARILHPATILPAISRNIPVRVLNTFRPDHKGTVILAHVGKTREVIKSIVYKEHIYLVNIASSGMLLQHGFLAKIFGVFEKYEINIDMVSTSEVTVSVTTDSSKNLNHAVRELSKFADVTVEKEKTIMGVVGTGIRDTRGVAARVFSAVAASGVNVLMISQGATKINVSFLIDDRNIRKAVAALHTEFFGRKKKAAKKKAKKKR